jgi:hypothetical protein
MGGKETNGGIEMGFNVDEKIPTSMKFMCLDEIINISEIENTNDLCRT